VSKQWKPGRATVALAPSRIRRAPVRPVAIKVPEISPEREIWIGVAGIVVTAICCAALALGIGIITSHRSAAAAAAASAAADSAAFGHCYNHGKSDCVFDGDTVFIDGHKIDIAGVDAPQLHPAGCAEEARRGTQAAVRLLQLMNSGPVSVGAAERGSRGDVRYHVVADGRDVGRALISAGVVRPDLGGDRGWCRPSVTD